MQRTLNENRGSFQAADLWFGTLNENWKAAMTGCTQWNTKFADALSDFQNEYAAFVRKRVQDAMILPAQLAACTSPIDVANTYSAFLTKTAVDYQKQYAHLAKVGQAASHLAPTQE